MKNFDSVYNRMILEQTQDLICENIISDIFKKVQQKISRKLIAGILSNRLQNVEKTQKLSSDQLRKLKKLEQDARKYKQIIQKQVLPIQVLKPTEEEKYLEQTISDIDEYLVRELGSWWKEHLLKQNEIKKLAKATSLKGYSYPLRTTQLTED